MSLWAYWGRSSLMGDNLAFDSHVGSYAGPNRRQQTSWKTKEIHSKTCWHVSIQIGFVCRSSSECNERDRKRLHLAANSKTLLLDSWFWCLSGDCRRCSVDAGQMPSMGSATLQIIRRWGEKLIKIFWNQIDQLNARLIEHCNLLKMFDVNGKNRFIDDELRIEFQPLLENVRMDQTTSLYAILLCALVDQRFLLDLNTMCLRFIPFWRVSSYFSEFVF